MIIRNGDPNEQAVMSTYHLWDRRLSYVEVGLLSVLLTAPGTRRVSFQQLMNLCREDYKTVRQIMQKLIEHGYITRRQARGSSSKYGAWEYSVYEFPRFRTKNKTRKKRIMRRGRMIY